MRQTARRRCAQETALQAYPRVPERFKARHSISRLDSRVVYSFRGGKPFEFTAPERDLHLPASARRILEAIIFGFGISCSQNRITIHPARLRVLVTNLSRFTFPESFFRQKAPLFAGKLLHFGQQCQKQPSTNTATRSRLKAKSGRPKIAG